MYCSPVVQRSLAVPPASSSSIVVAVVAHRGNQRECGRSSLGCPDISSDMKPASMPAVCVEHSPTFSIYFGMFTHTVGDCFQNT